MEWRWIFKEDFDKVQLLNEAFRLPWHFLRIRNWLSFKVFLSPWALRNVWQLQIYIYSVCDGHCHDLHWAWTIPRTVYLGAESVPETDGLRLKRQIETLDSALSTSHWKCSGCCYMNFFQICFSADKDIVLMATTFGITSLKLQFFLLFPFDSRCLLLLQLPVRYWLVHALRCLCPCWYPVLLHGILIEFKTWWNCWKTAYLDRPSECS